MFNFRHTPFQLVFVRTLRTKRKSIDKSPFTCGEFYQFRKHSKQIPLVELIKNNDVEKIKRLVKIYEKETHRIDRIIRKTFPNEMIYSEITAESNDGQAVKKSYWNQTWKFCVPTLSLGERGGYDADYNIPVTNPEIEYLLQKLWNVEKKYVNEWKFLDWGEKAM